MSELPALDELDVVLAMRQGLRIRHDHVEAMFQLGLAVHLVTEDADARRDPRYASVRLLPPGSTTGALLDALKDELQQWNAAFAVTFQETDIEAVGEANAGHAVSWSRPVADAIARDKARQRAHFAAAGLPSPRHWEIDDRDLTAGLPAVGYPCVVKPTRGASSSHVELVADAPGALRALAGIRELAASGQNHFYDHLDGSWALLEEYLPGEEVTCDGVVVDGEFHLGGIHSKVLSPPPFFEEDLYTLPGVDQATEEELTAVMRELSSSLDLACCLLNAEFRRDAEGRFRLVEFSTRISGGHVYRNIRDAHGIDLVQAFLLAAAGRPAAARAVAARRTPARLATCIRFVYRSGTVLANQVGEAWRHPGFRAYYPLAAPGDRISHAPEGFDICGLLSVWSALEPTGHPSGIHQLATEVEQLLDIRVEPNRRLLVIGSGGKPFREYALAAMSRRVDVILVSDAEISWQQPYVVESHVVDSYDHEVLEALVREVAPDGLLTYDEILVEPVARLAASVGLPYTDVEAVRRCKDKSALRALLAEAGVSPVRFGVAMTEQEAVRAADGIGYPVVLKPRALGGSIGVVQVRDEKELLAAFALAADAQAPDGTASAHSGVLIEEYLDGPEYSVDCVTWQGRTTPLVVAEKEIGFPPYFEETGHIVPAAPHPDLDAAVDMVVQAHAVVGLDRLVSHSEFKLTSRGPRIVEINVRLGGDLIPYLGHLSSGVDVAGAAASVAVGQEPDLSTDRSVHAAIGMIYPEHDLRLESVALRGGADRPGLERFTTFVPAGTEVRLPPDGFLSRVGVAIVTAENRRDCRARLAAVRADVVVEGTPLGES